MDSGNETVGFAEGHLLGGDPRWGVVEEKES